MDEAQALIKFCRDAARKGHSIAEIAAAICMTDSGCSRFLKRHRIKTNARRGPRLHQPIGCFYTRLPDGPDQARGRNWTHEQLSSAIIYLSAVNRAHEAVAKHLGCTIEDAAFNMNKHLINLDGSIRVVRFKHRRAPTRAELARPFILNA